MKSDKQLKKEFKKEASKNPDEYYATTVLRARGYERKHCPCGTHFWTVNKDQECCGDAECSGGFRLFENNPAKKQLSYAQVWHEFEEMFTKKGYESTPRYPVVARWNPTMDFTIASIAAFQPYVVSGAVAAPAKKLVIPQFCLRFGDIDNVGVTMSHMSGFVMIGQHQFLPKNEWDQDQAFEDIMDWLFEGLGLPPEEITFHEDAWAGGGNYGPCMEFFSRGVELGNQVYMLYEETPDGRKGLSLKVLDMGMGMERNAWFSQGRGTIYDATFPKVMKKLRERTGVEVDEAFMRRYTPVAAFLNLDETDDIDKAWEHVAQEIGSSVREVKEQIAPNTKLYAIAEHARALLVALADGALPGNVGGGYNLRVIYRRAQGFIDDNKWDLDLADVCEWHAQELKTVFPELLACMDDVRRILRVEHKKYAENKKKSVQVIKQALKKPVDEEALLRLYDSYGVAPEQVRAQAKKEGVQVAVPENFYQLLAERHEQREHKTATRREEHYDLDGIRNTKILYYDDHDTTEFTGTVVKVVDENKVVLDKTAFYPTSGGQEHDTGVLGGERVVDVFKQGGVILHVMKEKTDLKVGAEVEGHIDEERRLQLAKHHTTTHIINGAARKVLGNHVWQAGAAKTTEKARIDITHYETLSDDELKRIEDEANKVVEAAIPITKKLLPKNEAEGEHGFRLYQGGAVPGAEIRVVDIPDFDVEACGGTHLENTSQAGHIKILKSTKVQDGVVRIEFVSGPAAEKMLREEEALLEKITRALECKEDQVPGRCDELFKKWKKAKKGKLAREDATLTSDERYEGDVITEAAKRLKTQPEHVLKTINRFKDDIEKRVLEDS